MSVQRLALVEAQLIFHHLDPQSFLAFARCSRFMLQAASSHFAARNLISSVCSLQPELSGRVARSLLRFAPHLRLLWMSPVSSKGLTREVLLTLPRIHTLDAMHLQQAVIWPDVLARWSMRKLQVLRFHPDPPQESHRTIWREACGAALAALPALHTLEAHLRTPLLLHHLGAISALTDLTLHLRDPGTSAHCISECLQLRRLTLISFPASELPSVFANGTRPMVDLEELTLVQLWSVHRPFNGLRCLRTAPALRTLTFRQRLPLSELVHAMTSDLASDGPLRSVVLQVVREFKVPKVKDFRAMLEHLPLISVQIDHWSIVVPVASEPCGLCMTGSPISFHHGLKAELQQSMYNCERLREVDPHRVSITGGTVVPMPEDEVHRAQRRYEPASTAFAVGQSACCIV